MFWLIKKDIVLLSRTLFNCVYIVRPTIWTALSGMKVMKTTQSAFKNFVSDEFRTLPDADDRLFCTIVQCKWWYNTSAVNFERAW